MENNDQKLVLQYVIETVETWDCWKERYETYFADCSENKNVFFSCRIDVASWDVQVDLPNLQKDYEENHQ